MSSNGEVTDIMNENAKKQVKENSSYFDFGYDYFGPFLYGFTSWLYQGVIRQSADKVFFLARDGFMMEKAFAIFNADNSLGTEYVYFSRKSLRQALFHHTYSFEDSLKYFGEERYVNFGKLLEYYGFSSDEKELIAQDTNISMDTIYEWTKLKHDSALLSFYERYSDKIHEKSKKQAEYLKLYLDQISFEGNIAIVDIGWHGSMQYYLEEFVRQQGLSVTITGYYVGLSLRAPVQGEVQAYLYDEKDSRLRKKTLCFFGVYEKLFQSLEGSTKGYMIENGVISPILGKFEYATDEVGVRNITDWQMGAMVFVKEAYRQKLSHDDMREWAYPLLRLGERPTLKQVDLFKFLYNDDGGGREYFVSQKSLFQYSFKEFLYAFSASPWKTGFMKSVFKLPLPYYYIYRWLKK